ncbi:16S rRNA (guanine(966)-N(2))-methyltransferase RsmD [Trueperella bialowiezensis]|uniref:Ribosomal RNA small subunit methyltransferase D n=1 Tax=Trueperella bialowiezensis TaxID=312285 RepID=A0A448PGK7_9ACTO|nr:16S rRNA (guanine(966)-N(2))-methyltransferase RsmD [Trueperella bialowiezensis]VEI14033.1 Ribosomal RNA small subunit methyltransferase D [Trueperella bialowiezensis]
MTRIVAGTAGGLKLNVPKSGTRPTSERVREAIFSRLEHYGYIEDCAILDLYAGSGALGLEAKSRGASRVVAVEAHRPAAQVAIANAKATGLDIDVINAKAETFLANEPTHLFDVALLDPPYDISDEELAIVLSLLEPHLKDDAMVVVERSKKAPEPQWPASLVHDDVRKLGDTRVWSAVVRIEQAQPVE